MWLAVILFGLPLVEIALFVTIGAWLGLWLTLAIVLGTAVLGMGVIRQQGVQAGDDLRRALDARRSPGGALAEGAMKVAAGVLLILPGFFTDTCGALLLLPPVRRLLLALLASRVQVQESTWSDPFSDTRRGADVIDTTWEELPPQDAPPPPSGWTRH